MACYNIMEMRLNKHNVAYHNTLNKPYTKHELIFKWIKALGKNGK